MLGLEIRVQKACWSLLCMLGDTYHSAALCYDASQVADIPNAPSLGVVDAVEDAFLSYLIALLGEGIAMDFYSANAQFQRKDVDTDAAIRQYLREYEAGCEIVLE